MSKKLRFVFEYSELSSKRIFDHHYNVVNYKLKSENDSLISWQLNFTNITIEEQDYTCQRLYKVSICLKKNTRLQEELLEKHGT